MVTEAKSLDAKIDGVIIYQTGVRITQIGSIELAKGEQILKITDLPEGLDKESIRVKGKGNGQIVNIVVELNSTTEYNKKEFEKLRKNQETILKEIKRNEIKLERINQQIANYRSVEGVFFQDFPRSFAYGEVDMAKFMEFKEKIDGVMDSKVGSIETIEDQLEEQRKELQVLQIKINNIGPIEKVIRFYEIQINLNVTQAGKFSIELNYNMGQAYWIPFYDINLGEAKAQLKMMANVYNRTGTDWENVDIEISTASLRPIRLEHPQPIILEEYYPYIYEKKLGKKDKAFRGGKGMGTSSPKMALASDMLMEKEEDGDDEFYGGEPEAPPPPPEITVTQAEVSENIGVQSFKIPNRINIPSDKNPHPVNLAIQELETEKKYFWSCVAPENIIIQDTIINQDILLLAGNVKIYFLEEFLGETSIPVVAPKEKFKLGTRVSYDLKVDKKLVDRSKGKKVVRGRLKNNYEYKIIIKNLNEVPEQLNILDRIPHSNSENIKVEIEEIEPEPDKNEMGVLTWKIIMKDVKDKVIYYKYFIDYKSGISITPSLP